MTTLLRSAVILAAALAVASRAASAADADLPALAVPVAPAAAANIVLGSDFTNRRPADEPTAVRISQEADAIDVVFDVTQREPIEAATVTNGSGVTSDDYVEVALSPNGPQGFQYAFYANPRGARYQTSSENSAYTPPWGANATLRDGGYTVTIRIPTAIIRSGGRTAWRAQFVRSTVHANALDVWSFDPHAASVSDATFFGTLSGIGAQASATTARPRARAQIYGLDETTTAAQGGSTARIGGDLALPVAPTISVLASLHPDFSNVETDQQTISPTAFPRSFTEVRPFFTQAAQPFNATSSCVNCPQLLYTPAIPTYRDAYALEGTQGPLTFAAFDAVGTGRDDSAETLDYGTSNPHQAVGFNVQNVTVNESGGIRDQVSSLASGFTNQHSHFGAYFNYGSESGSAVSSASQGTYAQGGFVYATATTTGLLSWMHVGSQFAPFDAFVSQNDIDGPQLYFSKTLPFGAGAVLHDLVLSSYDSEFKNHAGAPAQDNAGFQLNADFRNLVTVHGIYSETAVRTFANEFLPFDGNGFLVGYKYSSATPSDIQYTGGPYYHGQLDAWTYLSTVPLTQHVRLSLEADRNSYFTHYIGEASETQWLERATLDFQLNRETEFDLGARRLIGPNLPVSFAPPNFTPLGAGNVSAALHYLSRSGRNEMYLVYGDPNSLITTPAFFVKYILYVGAPKGT